MQYAAAILYAWAASVLAAIALGFLHGGLDHYSAVFALCVGALAGLGGCIHARRVRVESAPPRGWEWFPIILFALFAARAFLWLIFTERDELRVLSPNNLGDMSLHLTYIEYFAKGAPFWPDNPIFASGKLAYAVGVDLFNSLLLLAGLDVIRGLIWVGLIGATLTAVGLWQWGRGFTLMGFLCAGGLLGFACFSQPSDQPFFQDYPGQMNLDWAWKSLPLSLLVTQRGFLFALPAGLLLLASWRTRFLLDGKGARLPFLGELLLYASMPVFHLHTFLALSFVLASWFIAHRAARKKIAAVVGAAFVPATVLVFITVGMFQANALPDWSNMSQVDNPPPRPPTQALGWQPGWMVNDPLNRFDPWTLLAGDYPAAAPWEAHGRFALFWLGNFGVLPFFAAVAAWMLLGRIRGKPLPAWWAVLAGVAFVAITPLLGQLPRYQTESIHGWMLGGWADSPVANIAISVVGAALVIAWVLAAKRKLLTPFWRACLLITASIFFADGLVSTVGTYTQSVSPLRANSIPLIAATVLFLLLLRAMARRKEPVTWESALLFPGIFLFFLCCNVKFAPSLWDNTKLMVWAYLLVLPAIWQTLIAQWSTWMRGIAMVGLFFSGFVTLLGGLNSQYEGYAIGSVTELQEVRDATSNIPITETFAAEPTYNHPLLLIGRKVVLGYPSHVWSHGINYAVQDRRLDGLMNGDKDWRIHASRLGARYLFFGPREARQWPESHQGWREGAAIVAEGRDWTLFDLETPPVPAVQ